MPAVSEKQRRLMMLARHAPEKVHKKNKAVTKMSKQQLDDFAHKVNAKAKNAIKKGNKPK